MLLGNIFNEALKPKQQQYNIDQEDEQKIWVSNNTLKPKFFKQLNFQAHAHLLRQKRKKQRRKNITNNKNFIRQNITKQLIQQTNTQKKIKTQKKLSQFFQYKGHSIHCKFDKDHLIHGDVHINYQNGSSFQGSFRNGKMTNGHFSFLNGYQYWGQLFGKKFQGKGTLKCPDGKRITGLWNGWGIEGRAQLQYPSGDVYYGQLKQFKKHGNGYLFFKSGNKYIGQFQNGQIHGYGAYFQKQIQICSGYWQNGVLIKNKEGLPPGSFTSFQQASKKDISQLDQGRIFFLQNFNQNKQQQQLNTNNSKNSSQQTDNSKQNSVQRSQSKSFTNQKSSQQNNSIY